MQPRLEHWPTLVESFTLYQVQQISQRAQSCKRECLKVKHDLPGGEQASTKARVPSLYVIAQRRHED